GMIRGKVQIMADERSNQLIIVTRPSNMQFFERIIKVLDIETAPEIAVEIIRLKYAKADTEDSEKGVADLLNELIDNTSNKNSEKDNQVNTANAAEGVNLTENRNLSERAQQISNTLSTTTKSKMGELKKENIKILADKRINAVMVMASPGDLAAIKEIIAAMDIPVAQVLIETVVLNVSLGDDLATGMQWVKRVSQDANGKTTGQYADSFGGGGTPTSIGSSPINLFNGGKDADGKAIPINAAIGAISGGSQYYGTIDKLNLDFLISATSSDSRTQVLESPILMTQDNKEATIESTKLAYLYNGMKYMGSSFNSGSSDYQPDIKQEEIGLHITVTPRINPDGTVVLDFEEEFQDATQTQKVPGDTSSGAGGDWPVPTTRKISGAIAVKDGQTVVIGGLVKQTKSETEGGIPVLRHIPWIGKYLFGYTEYKDSRDELLVFLTPYVFYTSEEAQKEAQRRKDYLDAAGVWNKGWSKSDLADTTDEQEMLRREKSKNKYELKQTEARAKRTEAQREHDKAMKELLKKNIERDKRELEEDREDLTAAEIEKREADIRNEEVMHEALLREINLDEEVVE
ncbi:MAG: secretin N-terminal domain-containing protein, partial [bacterium]|nr:secretin N-terminal domain-containing protein [bacterium]